MGLHVKRAFIQTKQNRLDQRKIPPRRDIGLRSYRQLSEFLTNSLPSGTGVRVESLPPGAFFPSFRPARKGQPTGGKSRKRINMKPHHSIQILLAIVCFALSPQTQAANTPNSPDPPPPPISNTADGDLALVGVTGIYNSAFGFYALLSNGAANFNTGVGAGVLLSNTANQQTAVGTGTLLTNTTGENNTGCGTFALFTNSTGGFNNAVGANSLLFNVDGSSNNALGESALFNNISGAANTAIGDAALSNTTGSANIALGAAPESILPLATITSISAIVVLLLNQA